jgi:hypothetical protein
MPGNCSVDGWCWQAPTPNGNEYFRAFGTDSDNIWLTAWDTVLQWNGTTWTQHHPPALAGQPVNEAAGVMIGGTSSNDTWLVYGTALEHWDGTSWTIRESLTPLGNPAYDDLWVAPNGDCWVTRSDGNIELWAGGSATKPQMFSIGGFAGAIWGTSSSDFFVTALPSAVYHFDGHTFNQIYNGNAILSGYQGVQNDVWVSGPSGALEHWDGNGLTPVTLPITVADWQSMIPAGYVSPGNIWWFVENAEGGLLHWDGTSFTFVPVTTPDTSNWPFTYGAYIGGEFWFVGRNGVVATMPTPFTLKSVIGVNASDWGEFNGIWGASDNDMYFSVGTELRHWDGESVSTMSIDPTFSGVLGTVAGVPLPTGDDELFVSGYDGSATVVFHYDETGWTTTSVPGGVNGFVVFGPGEAMAIGQSGYMAHFSGGQWQTVTTGTTNMLTGAFAPDANHLWVSGLAGTVLAWDRANPSVTTLDTTVSTTDDLGPIAGSSGDTWLADVPAGSFWHNPGTGWVQVSGGQYGGVGGNYSSGLLFTDAAHGLGESDGQNHTIRWNGSAWSYEDNMSSGGMPRLFQAPGGSTWAGGENGIVRHTGL